MDEQFAEELKALLAREGITLEGHDQYLEGDYVGTRFAFIRQRDGAEVDAQDLIDRYL